jgi:epsilon-lactone hydrolase
LSREQREALDTLLREGPLDLGGDVSQQRAIFDEMTTAIRVPDDVAASPGSLGGTPVVDVTVSGADPAKVIVYLHGGAYAIGSAASSVGLASDLARRAGARLVSVDYRLAPEHPHPAAVEDVVGAYRGLLGSQPAPLAIALAGESAGAGLVVATLVALGSAGLPQPTAAVLMSPWADLTLSGTSMNEKAALDPALTPEGLRRRAADYAGESDPAAARISPIFADLTGLPPLLIQAGSHEILLDDAARLAARAAAADVAVTLEITPDVPHVFQGFAAMLDEADVAPTSAGAFLREHLGGLLPRSEVESAAMLGGVARLGAFRLSRPGASFVAMIGLSTAPSCQRRSGASSERLSEFLASFWRLGPHDLAL